MQYVGIKQVNVPKVFRVFGVWKFVRAFGVKEPCRDQYDKTFLPLMIDATDFTYKFRQQFGALI